MRRNVLKKKMYWAVDTRTKRKQVNKRIEQVSMEH